MVRFIIQTCLLLLVFAFAFRRGGAPEKYVASIFMAMFIAGIGSRLVTGGWSEQSYISVQLFRFFVDTTALVAIVAVALKCDRWWVLWVGSVQTLAVTAHIIKALGLPMLPLAYAVMERWPGWIAIFLIALGTWLHIRREEADPDIT